MADRAEPVDKETFITIWQTSGTLAEAAKRTGLQKNSASQRATNLRRAGIDLKEMPKRPPGKTPAQLQQLAASLLTGSPIEPEPEPVAPPPPLPLAAAEPVGL